jgi:hypothetical protein
MKPQIKTALLTLIILVLGAMVYSEYLVEKKVEVWEGEVIKLNNGANAAVTLVVKNNKAIPVDVFVETGIIPEDLSSEWFGYGFSYIFKQRATACCAGQVNIKGATITLMPGETRTLVYPLIRPYYGIDDKCGDTQYYAANGRYKLYAVAASGCHYLNGVEQAYELYDKSVTDY